MSDSKTINEFTRLFGVKVILSWFKQLPLTSTLIFELRYSSFSERLLFDVVDDLIFPFDNH